MSLMTFTDDNFEQEVLQSDTPVLVDFWAPWCGPCRALGPTIEELAGAYAGSVKVGKLDTDQNPKTAQAYNIMSIPAVLVFKDGKPVQNVLGAQPKSTYMEILDGLKS